MVLSIKEASYETELVECGGASRGRNASAGRGVTECWRAAEGIGYLSASTRTCLESIMNMQR